MRHHLCCIKLILQAADTHLLPDSYEQDRKELLGVFNGL